MPCPGPDGRRRTASASLPRAVRQVDAGVVDQLVLGDPTAPRFVYWDKKLRPTPSGEPRFEAALPSAARVARCRAAGRKVALAQAVFSCAAGRINHQAGRGAEQPSLDPIGPPVVSFLQAWTRSPLTSCRSSARSGRGWAWWGSRRPCRVRGRRYCFDGCAMQRHSFGRGGSRLAAVPQPQLRWSAC